MRVSFTSSATRATCFCQGHRYHLDAPLGNEKFLAPPRRTRGGKLPGSHIQRPDGSISSCSRWSTSHDETAQEMLSWPYGHPGAVDHAIRGHDRGRRLPPFPQHSKGLDIEGLDIDGAAETYWDHSLFGGLRKSDDRAEPIASACDIRDGAAMGNASSRGRSPNPMRSATPCLKTLGYAADNSDWVALCLPMKDVEKSDRYLRAPAANPRVSRPESCHRTKRGIAGSQYDMSICPARATMTLRRPALGRNVNSSEKDIVVHREIDAAILIVLPISSAMSRALS